MAGGDGTGPAGMGPMTGRAAGYCAGYATPGYMNPYGGRFGVGNNFGYPATSMGGQYAAPYSAWGTFPRYAGMYRPRGRFIGLRGGRGGGRRRW